MLSEVLRDTIANQLDIARTSLRNADLALKTVENIMALTVPDASPEPERRPPSPVSESEDEGGIPGNAVTPETCSHPKQQRMRSAVMGKPNQFLCTECGGTVNPDEE